MKLQDLYEAKEVNLSDVQMSQYENEEFHGDFNCFNLQLTTLKGSPKEVTGYFDCSYNELKSLKYCPSIIKGNFHANNNPQLTSFDCSIARIDGDLYCYNSKLKSLKNIHMYIKEIKGGEFDVDFSPIESHVLGLLKIKGVKLVNMNRATQARDILNKWLKEPFGNGRVLGAQSDLIEAGLDAFAQL